MSLMERMKVASDLQNMSMSEKFFGGIQVALFGIGIVFIALFLLFLIIKVLETALHKGEDKNKASVAKTEADKVQAPAKAEENLEEEAVDDAQLVAVITAAVAASLHTSTHNIVVRNIVRVPDTTPAWGRLGRMQQVNRME